MSEINKIYEKIYDNSYNIKANNNEENKYNYKYLKLLLYFQYFITYILFYIHASKSKLIEKAPSYFNYNKDYIFLILIIQLKLIYYDLN